MLAGDLAMPVVTLAEARATIAAILTRLREHGLIAS